MKCSGKLEVWEVVGVWECGSGDGLTGRFQRWRRAGGGGQVWQVGYTYLLSGQGKGGEGPGGRQEQEHILYQVLCTC